MRTHQTRRAVCAAIAALTLGALCETSVAANSGDNADARPIAVDVDSGPITLAVQTPSGGTSRLTYADDDGWRLDDRDTRLKSTEARITPASTEPQKEASGSERPMTVFIDGPTGYTYVWMRDQGWKFVGRLSDRKR
ncbi:hypothetical protein AWB75_03257 [Caballeronia catudaia]|uniref:Lipoprotein n=1 Tax=Caballeronia catudaia TaxID=1777136 RepID=A0A158BE78_9BURK|nr:hypothetical protein [Caballeronia catudaia]SAK67667.1 hypothetical protein AWB75_03257 [Caballeronia catudaia]